MSVYKYPRQIISDKLSCLLFKQLNLDCLNNRQLDMHLYTDTQHHRTSQMLISPHTPPHTHNNELLK